MMEGMMVEKDRIQEELTELLNEYYNGSFAQLVCDYIHATGITKEEVEELLEAMKHLEKEVLHRFM